LTADHENIESDTGIAYSIVPPSRALADGQPHAGGFYDINANIQPFQRVDAWGVALHARHSLRAVDLVSITAYRKNRIHFGFDNDITPVAGVDVDIFTRRDSFSQELQVMSNTDGRFTWITGLFYFDDEAGYGPPHGLSLQGIFLPTAPAGPNIKNMIDTQSYAVYGEGTYALTDDTRLTLGARWTRDERKLSGKIDVYLPGVGFVAEVPTPEIKKTFEKPSFRVVLDHDFTSDVFGYVSYNRGFKSGNFNTVDATNPPFEPETLDAYEAGVKTQWLDNRLTINLAAFHYKYKNMQFVTQQGVTTQTKNAAGAEIDGAEVDLSWLVTDNFSVTAAGSYVDAKYTKFPEGTCTEPIPTGGNIVTTCDVKGNRVLRTPEWTFTVMPSYRFNTPIGQFDANVTYNYNDGFFWHPENRLKEDPYHIVNADLTWSRPDSPFSITLYGRNLLDERYSLYTETGPLANQYSAAAPLTWGAEFRVQF
jgi:iron complex outermembrane receptor protein